MNLHTAKRRLALRRIIDSAPADDGRIQWPVELLSVRRGDFNPRDFARIDELSDTDLIALLDAARLCLALARADHALALSLTCKGLRSDARTANREHRAARLAERHVAAVVEARLADASETIRILRAALKKGAVASRKRAA